MNCEFSGKVKSCIRFSGMKGMNSSWCDNRNDSGLVQYEIKKNKNKLIIKRKKLNKKKYLLANINYLL
jgi:hypothetical protein